MTEDTAAAFEFITEHLRSEWLRLRRDYYLTPEEARAYQRKKYRLG